MTQLPHIALTASILSLGVAFSGAASALTLNTSGL